MKLLKHTFIFLFILTFINVNAQKDESISQDSTVLEDNMPQFPGGDQARLSFLSNNISYPEDAKSAGIEGTVHLSFVVEKDGSITNVKVNRGVSPSINKEAIFGIKKMPKWKPGIKNGKAVRSIFYMPVLFYLSNYDRELIRKKRIRKEKRALKKKQRAEAKAKKE